MIRVIVYAGASLGRDCLVSRLSGRADVAVLAAGDGLDHLVAGTPNADVDVDVDVVLVLPVSGEPLPLTRIREYWPSASVVLGHFDREFAPQTGNARALRRVSLTGSVDDLVLQLAGSGDVPGEASRPGVTECGLSHREVDILKHLALGHSSRESAGLLGLSPRTVDGHRRRVSGKLERTSVAELTRYAIATGLVSAGSGLPRVRKPISV